MQLLPSGSSRGSLNLCPPVHPPEPTCLQPRIQSFISVLLLSLFFPFLHGFSVCHPLLSQRPQSVSSPENRVCKGDHSSFAGTANAVAGAVKYSESAGGFYYVESGKLFSVTRNRFIHW